MGSFEEFLGRGKRHSKTASDLTDLGRGAARSYIEEGTSLNDSVKSAMKEHGLTEHQTRRVIEAANQSTYKALMDSQTDGLNIAFDVADPSSILGSTEKVAAGRNTFHTVGRKTFHKFAPATGKESDDTTRRSALNRRPAPSYVTRIPTSGFFPLEDVTTEKVAEEAAPAKPLDVTVNLVNEFNAVSYEAKLAQADVLGMTRRLLAEGNSEKEISNILMRAGLGPSATKTAAATEDLEDAGLALYSAACAYREKTASAATLMVELEKVIKAGTKLEREVILRGVVDAHR